MATVALRAEVIVRSELLFRCVIQGRLVDLPPTSMQQGTTVRRSGDQGIVVVPTWVAAALDLEARDVAASTEPLVPPSS